MKKLSISAFSLTELIVATTVISIIMLGVVTSNVALQQSSKNFSTSYYNNQSTTTTLNHILLNASRAVGDISLIGVQRNLGIAIGANAPPIGLDSNGNPINNRPVGGTHAERANTFCIFQGAGWICYTLRTNNVHACNKTTPLPCLATDNPPSTIIGTAKTLTPTFTVNTSTTAPQPLGAVFTVIIENCPNLSIQCAPGNIKNPYIQKTGNVSPGGHSAS